jgi:hypothetical protein
MRSAILRIFFGVVATCAAAAVPALPGPEAPPACPAIDPPASAAGGVRAFIDPVTRKLRPPTAAEKRQLVSALRDRASRTYEVVVRPDGSRVVELDDTFLMSVVATKGPDGALRYRCVNRRAAPAAEEK